MTRGVIRTLITIIWFSAGVFSPGLFPFTQNLHLQKFSHAAFADAASLTASELRPNKADHLKGDQPVQGQLRDDTASSPNGMLVRIQISNLSPPWYLVSLGRLVDAGREDEAYQLVLTGIALHPESAELRVAAAYVAALLGRCSLAEHHLAAVKELPTWSYLYGEYQQIRVQCFGPWQRQYSISALMGYRQSLVGRAAVTRLTPEAGSLLYQVCASLWGLCNPNRGFKLSPPKDNGVDLWVMAQIENRYRPLSPWQHTFTTTVFRRHPSRPGFDGRGVTLRAESVRTLPHRHQIAAYAEIGHSVFHQGRADLNLSQLHWFAGGRMYHHHGDLVGSLAYLSELHAKSFFLDLRERTAGYQLVLAPEANQSAWLNGSLIWMRQVGRSYHPGYRGRRIGAGVQQKYGSILLQAQHQVETQKFQQSLTFLAAPHHATTHRTSLSLAITPDEIKNLKVVLSLGYRKISTPDPFRPARTKNATLSIKYTFGNSL